jgi:hypothetical protein
LTSNKGNFLDFIYQQFSMIDPTLWIELIRFDLRNSSKFSNEIPHAS